MFRIVIAMLFEIPGMTNNIPLMKLIRQSIIRKFVASF